MKINNLIPNYQFSGSNTESRLNPSQTANPAEVQPLQEAGIASGPPPKTSAGDLNSGPGVYSKPKSGDASENSRNVSVSQDINKNINNDATAEAKSSPSPNPFDKNLSQREKLEVAELRMADMEVKSHERAHLAAAGQYARSGANYKYVQGPDGKNYAVAGEVQIDSSEESTPQMTITKMEVVQRAALAPVNPSAQDRQVAAGAMNRKLAAYEELRLQRNLESAQQKEKETTETEKKQTSYAPEKNDDQTSRTQPPANDITTPSFPLFSRSFSKRIDIKI